MVKYLLRLDDACPTMHAERWLKIEQILDKYGIRPMVGVIPNNEDELQQCSPENNSFWELVRLWEAKGWSIALHGFNHCYISNNAGINPLWTRSEFAGLPLDTQTNKISQGVNILRTHGINPKYFFAPSHTFDRNTLKAIETCSDIRVISDTIATKPYRRYGFVFIPQLGGRCMEIKLNGFWTFCLHPSFMSDSDFEAIDKFLSSHVGQFISFNEINLTNIGRKDILSRLLSLAYFTRRRIYKLIGKL